MKVTANASRLVLGFYGSVEHAEEALREFGKSRFRRSAVVHRGEDARLIILYAGLSSRARWAASCTLAAGFVLLGEILHLRGLEQALAGLFGFALFWFGAPWLRLGSRKRLLRDYGRFVLPAESLVVVRTTEAGAADAIEVFQRVSHPFVFAIRPGLRSTLPTQFEDTLHDPVTMSGLPARAEELANSHRLDTSAKSRSLLPRLRECESAIERARADLAEAARLGYGIAHAAEWLLDNTYLIRSHIAEIRHNLPNNHCKILPVLIDTTDPVRLRIYHVAADLVLRSGYRVSSENIVAYLTAYQLNAPLTIAELWVFPLMLRLVLLEKLRRLSESASRRQHQKEMADFWANRLLNAVNLGPGWFEKIVAQLDREGNDLTLHFIARLGEQLHKEELTLAPIQKWIEAKTGFRIADMNLREHAEEASDLMLISESIGSLRRLSELEYPKLVEAVSRMEAILREIRLEFMLEATSPHGIGAGRLLKRLLANRRLPS